MDNETVIDLKFEDEHNHEIEEHRSRENKIFRRGEEFAFNPNEKETIFPSARKIYQRSRGSGGRSSIGIF
jgi:hypothetical protein